ncbi:hypothetical protein [Marmoricola endophyticus]|uniref:hypothetical protein n=1 Tax=Marmoricola endophyticus TaxID=2040280 RepID=UPI001667CF37|nr:hypothetical protein [Marmoricola endophyticus]
MTSAPVDLFRVREQATPRADVGSTAAQEPVSPASRVLPWALLLLVLSLVATAYAVVLQAGSVLTGALVVAVAVLGAVAGLCVRDARDRWVSTGRALGDGARRLGRALWH